MDIQYKLIRSKRKTVCITVGADAVVIVKAPIRFPKREIDKIVYKHKEWIIAKQMDRAADKRSALTDEDKKLLRRIAEKVIPQRLLYLSRVTGLVPEKIRIGGAEKRFGSCSEKGNITVSFYVIMYPEKAQELVLMHELCHLRHMNHSNDFYSLLSSFLPDHKERKKLLSGKYTRSMDEIKQIYSELL